jgi:hypothetical protein
LFLLGFLKFFQFIPNVGKIARKQKVFIHIEFYPHEADFITEYPPIKEEERAKTPKKEEAEKSIHPTSPAKTSRRPLKKTSGPSVSSTRNN